MSPRKPKLKKKQISKIQSECLKEVKNNALFFKKRAEFQTLVKKQEEMHKAFENASKLKKRKRKDNLRARQ